MKKEWEIGVGGGGGGVTWRQVTWGARNWSQSVSALKLSMDTGHYMYSQAGRAHPELHLGLFKSLRKSTATTVSFCIEKTSKLFHMAQLSMRQK